MTALGVYHKFSSTGVGDIRNYEWIIIVMAYGITQLESFSIHTQIATDQRLFH